MNIKNRKYQFKAYAQLSFIEQDFRPTCNEVGCVIDTVINLTTSAQVNAYQVKYIDKNTAGYLKV